MADIPQWHVEGDWFDVCKCNIPCPCEFAQAPTSGDCEGILAWHIRQGRYGGVSLDGLNVLGVGAFTGNVWKDAKVAMGMFIDERADVPQREALQTIFSGQAGGWPGEFAQKIGEVRGIEYAPIEFEVAGDLATWRADDPRQGSGAGGSADRPDDGTGSPRAIVESAGLGSRAARQGCRDVGHGGHGSRRRLRLQVEPQRTIQQAHSLRLARP